MNPSSKYIIGECVDMCPQAEIILREKEGLLHILEVLPNNEKDKKPRADRSRVVKCFARSAAGKQMHDPKNLRPPHVLFKTIRYLFREAMVSDKISWHLVYDFIMDRLRSIRQDMIIQNFSVTDSIRILQPIVRFYAYSSYRLCEESLYNFDPFINKTHLQECLKRLLYLYDEYDYTFTKFTCKQSHYISQVEESRPLFEALYVLLNLGDSTALKRALSLKHKYKNYLKLAMTLSIDYTRNNFVKVCRLVNRLPILLQCVMAIHIPEIRRRAFHIMSLAYNSKNSHFPLEVLKELLLYENIKDVSLNCVYYGLRCKETDVQFTKTDFDSSKSVLQPTRLSFIEDKLNQIDIPNLILNG